VLPKDCRRILKLFKAKGYKTSMKSPHWLGKIESPDGHYVDLIFSSGNGICGVDEAGSNTPLPARC